MFLIHKWILCLWGYCRKAINKGIGVDNMHYLNDGLWKVLLLLFFILLPFLLMLSINIFSSRMVDSVALYMSKMHNWQPILLIWAKNWKDCIMCIDLASRENPKLTKLITQPLSFKFRCCVESKPSQTLQYFSHTCVDWTWHGYGYGYGVWKYEMI